MSRLLLVLALLSTAVRAANPVFGAYGTSQCDACLDETYQSCPGDYQTRPYAECMCAGDGGTNFVSCMPYCDGGINEPGIAAGAFYSYCIMFFKEMCPNAEEHVSSDIFERECSKEAIAAGGIGEKSGSGSDDESETGSDSGSGTKTKETASKDASETKETDEPAETTSGATPMAISAWGIIVALGLTV